jgi:hypothetical protein
MAPLRSNFPERENGTPQNPRPNFLPKLSIDLGTHP